LQTRPFEVSGKQVDGDFMQTVGLTRCDEMVKRFERAAYVEVADPSATGQLIQPARGDG